MPSQPIYRIDKFIVPAAARERFMERLKETHRVLNGAEGCQRNLVMEQISGDSEFNIITFVEWRDAASYEMARAASQARHAASGFDPKQFMDELGVKADLGNYAVAASD